MATPNSSPNRGPFYPNEIRWLRWSIPDQLDGSQIVSVTFACTSPVTEVALSKAIYTRAEANDSVKARFDFNGAPPGHYAITATMTTDDSEDIIETIIAQVVALPA